MKKPSPVRLAVMVWLLLTVSACSAGTATQQPTVAVPTQESAVPTETPVLSNPTDTVSAPPTNELSEADVLGIVRSSLASYPWRLTQTVLVKESGQTTGSLTEAQSGTRGYNQSVQSVGSETITIETILVDSTVYLRITGSGVAESYGLVDGQWTEIPADSPLSQLVDRSAIDPARIAEIFATDFASMPKEAGAGELLFTRVGSEDVNGVATDIYEAKGATFTYRWWIGSDGRFHKTTVDLPQATRTMLMEYDPGITVQSPIP